MFSLAQISCTVLRRRIPAVDKMFRLPNYKGVMNNGDGPYMAPWYPATQTEDAWGYRSVRPNVNSIRQAYRERYIHWHLNPDIQRLVSAGYYFNVVSDHMACGNNWDHTAAKAQSGNAPLAGATGTVVHTHWGYAYQTFAEFTQLYGNNHLGNRLVSVPELSENLAIEGGTYDESNYIPLCWSIGFDRKGNINNDSPHLLVVIVDSFSSTESEGSGKYRLGPLQMAAIESALSETTAPLKLVVLEGFIGPSDTWTADYSWFGTMMAAADEWTMPGGVMVAAGDAHAGLIAVDETYGFAQVLASGSNFNALLSSDAKNSNYGESGWDPAATPTDGQIIGHRTPVFSSFIVTDTELIGRLQGSGTGEVYGSIIIDAGSVTPRTGIGTVLGGSL